LVVDDNGEAGSYFSDLVLNQNFHASADLYSHRQGYTKLLLGSRYAMLRREFKPWRGWTREIAQTRRVLVSMGGTDTGNLSERVIQALGTIGDSGLEARVVVGAGNPYLERLRKSASQSRRSVNLEINPANMPELIAWADVAVSAAGST